MNTPAGSTFVRFVLQFPVQLAMHYAAAAAGAIAELRKPTCRYCLNSFLRWMWQASGKTFPFPEKPDSGGEFQAFQPRSKDFSFTPFRNQAWCVSQTWMQLVWEENKPFNSILSSSSSSSSSVALFTFPMEEEVSYHQRTIQSANSTTFFLVAVLFERANLPNGVKKVCLIFWIHGITRFSGMSLA